MKSPCETYLRAHYTYTVFNERKFTWSRWFRKALKFTKISNKCSVLLVIKIFYNLLTATLRNLLYPSVHSWASFSLFFFSLQFDLIFRARKITHSRCTMLRSTAAMLVSVLTHPPRVCMYCTFLSILFVDDSRETRLFLNICIVRNFCSVAVRF